MSQCGHMSNQRAGKQGKEAPRKHDKLTQINSARVASAFAIHEQHPALDVERRNLTLVVLGKDVQLDGTAP